MLKFGIKGEIYLHIYLKKIHGCVKSKKTVPCKWKLQSATKSPKYLIMK